MSTSSVIRVVGVSQKIGTYAATFSASTISLADDTDFTLVETVPYVTQGIATSLLIAPTTSTGQVTLKIYQDTSRLVEVFEYVFDLTDSSTYRSSSAFGFTSDISGTLYGTIYCSGVPISQTATFTLVANGMTPNANPVPLASPYSNGIEDDGTGKPQVALATASGLEFSSAKLRIKSDTTAAAYVTYSTGGAAVTGTVNTTTNQSVAGEKRFAAYGLIAQATSGHPTTGTWSTGTTILDADLVKWFCTSGGTPGTWELSDTVSEYSTIVNTSTVTYGNTELLKIPVYGNVGSCIWLRVWARRASGTAEMQVPFRVRVYETTAALGRELVWQGLGLARQTYLTVSLPASQSYLEVNSNDIAEVDELLCIYESNSRYELGRCSARLTGYLNIDEALVDASSWDINTLVLPVSEWWNVPWINRDGDAGDQNNILLEIRHDGLSTDPDLVFYAQALAQSRGIIR